MALPATCDDALLVCEPCGVRTRANLTECPTCQGPLTAVPLPAEMRPTEFRKFEKWLASKNWFRILQTILTVVVVASNAIGLSQMQGAGEMGIAFFVCGITLPIVFFFFPQTLAILRYRNRRSALRGTIFLLMVLPVFGLADSGISPQAATWLVGSYLALIVVLWIAQDRELGPERRRKRSTHVSRGTAIRMLTGAVVGAAVSADYNSETSAEGDVDIDTDFDSDIDFD